MTRTIAIIPARGGSKRIPRKNVKPFLGKPMIAWSIEAALDSGLFDRIIVSTDDLEIADVARAHGAEVPFMRPPELANDFATTGAVMAHAVQWLNDAGESPEAVCCIYATAPLLEADRLKEGRAALEGRRYAFSVTDYAFPIQRALRQTAGGGVDMFWPEHRQTRSQDLEPAFHDAAQFYWGWAQAWLDGEAIFAPHSAAVKLSRTRVVDIDTPEDWELAELAAKMLNQ